MGNCATWSQQLYLHAIDWLIYRNIIGMWHVYNDHVLAIPFSSPVPLPLQFFLLLLFFLRVHQYLLMKSYLVIHDYSLIMMSIEISNHVVHYLNVWCYLNVRCYLDTRCYPHGVYSNYSFSIGRWKSYRLHIFLLNKCSKY